jgi:hypothetical protein
MARTRKYLTLPKTNAYKTRTVLFKLENYNTEYRKTSDRPFLSFSLDLTNINMTMKKQIHTNVTINSSAHGS